MREPLSRREIKNLRGAPIHNGRFLLAAMKGGPTVTDSEVREITMRNYSGPYASLLTVLPSAKEPRG